MDEKDRKALKTIKAQAQYGTANAYDALILLDIIDRLEAKNSSLKKTVLMAFGLPGVKNYLQLEAENEKLREQSIDDAADAMKEVQRRGFLSKENAFLKSQLIALKKAGEPLREALQECRPPKNCDERFFYTPIEKAARRLAEALEGVKDE